MAWSLDGLQDGRLGDFVEHNAVGLLLVEAEHLAEVPRDGFSLAVLIGCQPYLLGFLGLRTQVCHQLGLLFRNFIFRFERLLVDAQLFLLQVADMAIARHHLEVRTEELLNCLRFCRRLHDH